LKTCLYVKRHVPLVLVAHGVVCHDRAVLPIVSLHLGFSRVGWGAAHTEEHHGLNEVHLNKKNEKDLGFDQFLLQLIFAARALPSV
jgi:hypothetical protein